MTRQAWRPPLLIARLQLREWLRDKSVILGLVQQAAIFLVMGLAIPAAMGSHLPVDSGRPVPVAVEGNVAAAPRLTGLLAAQGLRLVPVTDARAAVRDHRQTVGIILPATGDAALASGHPAPVVPVVLSSRAASRLDTAVLAGRIASADGVGSTLAVRVTDLGRTLEGTRRSARRTLPSYALVLAFVTMGLGVSSISSQRTKRSLDAALVLPVSRLHLLAGRWLALMAVGTATIALFYGVADVASWMHTPLRSQLPWTGAVALTVSALPDLAVLTALALLIAVASRSPQRANAAMGLATAGVFGLFFAAELVSLGHATAATSLVPLLGPMLVARSAFDGAFAFGGLALTAVVAGGITAALLAVAARSIGRDRMVTRVTG